MIVDVQAHPTRRPLTTRVNESRALLLACLLGLRMIASGGGWDSSDDRPTLSKCRVLGWVGWVATVSWITRRRRERQHGFETEAEALVRRPHTVVMERCDEPLPAAASARRGFAQQPPDGLLRGPRTRTLAAAGSPKNAPEAECLALPFVCLCACGAVLDRSPFVHMLINRNRNPISTNHRLHRPIAAAERPQRTKHTSLASPPTCPCLTHTHMAMASTPSPCSRMTAARRRLAPLLLMAAAAAPHAVLGAQECKVSGVGSQWVAVPTRLES